MRQKGHLSAQAGTAGKGTGATCLHLHLVWPRIKVIARRLRVDVELVESSKVDPVS
jgi:hypothetical protein